MALIPTPTGADVYAASKLSPEHFETEETGPLTGDDVKAMIEAEILPDIVSDINQAVDETAAPFDYPFDYETLRVAYPVKSDASIQEWIPAQNGRFKKIILWEALAELYTRVASLEDAYDRKAQMYKTWAQNAKKTALESIRSVVAGTAAVTSQGVEDEIGLEIVYPYQPTGL